MRISALLLILILVITLTVGFAWYLSSVQVQKQLEHNAGTNFALITKDTMAAVDRHMYSRIERLQLYSKTSFLLSDAISASNQEFEKLKDVLAFIDEKDQEWISAPEKSADFVNEITNNELSEQLRERLNFYAREYGFDVYEEMFVTNKYGANVAQTGKTNDYKHDDEEWWQKAKEEGLYLGDCEYDSSAGTCFITFATRIDDEEGDFLGVLKSVYNIQDVTNILTQLVKDYEREEYKTVHISLVTKDERIIYTSKEEEKENILKLFSSFEGGIPYFIIKGDEAGEPEELVSYAYSEGYNNYKHQGWFLVITQETEEIFSPIIRARTTLLITTSIVIIIIILTSLFVTFRISKPLKKLMNGISIIGEGNLKHVIDVKGKNELGEIATAFNKMVSDLRKLYVGLEKQVEQKTRYLKRKTEELISANEKLKEVDRLKTDFLNTTSHELKTPLTPVRSYLDLLEDESLGKLNSEQKSALKVIDNNMTLLKKLIDDILDITKVEAGRMKFFINRLDFKKIIQEAIKNQHSLADEKYIRIKVSIDAKTPLVEGDSLRVFQVITNLLNNAIKFSPQNSEITIQIKNQKNKVQISVSDKGIGISVEDMPKLFTKFFQIDNTATRNCSGTGLGLAICKGIIKAHNGQIWVESELKKGSTFYFTLPSKR